MEKYRAMKIAGPYDFARGKQIAYSEDYLGSTGAGGGANLMTPPPAAHDDGTP